MMHWLELIRIQAAWHEDSVAAHELTVFLEGLDAIPGLKRTTLYREGSAYGDLAVVLMWETDSAKIGGSEEGLHLTRFAKELGLVSHSVWLSQSSSK
jgi:hypothetical protein